MQRRAGRAASQVVTALRRARDDYKRMTTPQPDLPGVRRPFLIDTELWERLETDDIKYALKLAWKEYKQSLQPILDPAGYRKLKEEEERAAEAAEEQKDAEAGAAPSGEQAEQATAGRRVGAAAREAASKLSSAELRESAVKVAAQLASAIKDPAARAKVAELGTRAVIGAHNIVDSFLIGYYEGQAEELAKEKKEQEEEEAEKLRQQQEGGSAGATSGGVGSKTAFDVLTEVLLERQQKDKEKEAGEQTAPPSVAAPSSSSAATPQPQHKPPTAPSDATKPEQ